MSHLFERLKESILDWRSGGYACDEYPPGKRNSRLPDGSTGGWPQPLKFLRDPQFFSLEVYWYVRLELKTPHILDVYKHYYGDDKKAFFDALGIPMSRDALEWAQIDGVIEKVKKRSGLDQNSTGYRPCMKP